MKKPILLTITAFFLINATTDRPAKTLKEVYKNAFKMGCSVNDAIVSGRDSISYKLVLQQFNSITAENVLKAETLNPRPGVWNFAPADAFVQFGQENNLFIIGHTLVWHNQTPDWFFNDENGKPKAPEAVVEKMRSYIETVAERYKGKVNARSAEHTSALQ